MQELLDLYSQPQIVLSIIIIATLLLCFAPRHKTWNTGTASY